MGIPLTRRHPSTSKKEGDVEKSADSDGYHAPNASDRQRHEEGSFHHGRQMFRHGWLDGSVHMEQGGAHAHMAILFLPNFSPTKKFGETSYLSIGVRLRGNQEHPITQATDPKKAGGTVGGVKDDGATLDC